MRVAICLSGQPRNSELCHPFIMDNIVICPHCQQHILIFKNEINF